MARALVNVPTSGVIGEIKASMMTLVQFQAQFGTNWVLANGGSAIGTKYATITGNVTLPDCRGMSLRGKNNGRADGNQNPDGDVALGTMQLDSMQNHAHPLGFDIGTKNQGSDSLGNSGTRFANGSTGSANGTFQPYLSGPTLDAGNGAPRVAGETRMKNVTVNYFIKVD